MRMCVGSAPSPSFVASSFPTNTTVAGSCALCVVCARHGEVQMRMTMGPDRSMVVALVVAVAVDFFLCAVVEASSVQSARRIAERCHNTGSTFLCVCAIRVP